MYSAFFYSVMSMLLGRVSLVMTHDLLELLKESRYI